MKDLSHSQERSLRFDAAPFYPTGSTSGIMSSLPSSSYEFAIYNEGKPCMMATSEADVNNILHGIQDDALDEGFPPDARDAAELEDVDAYNEMQALLDLMEERDEEARERYSHVGKRWESRRQQGLGVGQKPKQASSSALMNRDGTSKAMMMPHSPPRIPTQAIQTHSHHNFSNKVMHDMDPRRPDRSGGMGRQSKGMYHYGPREVRIQQPRK
ncbi:hypothetical protein MPSEU_001092600 [Mayamaea pseudoterrestris]|nr:hypothetical protein MPSEU_001092600 [Mayamaea pseudoterrestris]